MVTLTPGMQQYMNVKNEHPDCIILFRMGDFYETFFEDAKTVARELNITLTARGKGDTKAPLAGIPYHSIDPYIAKLIKKGYKIGIVEQTEDPKKAKGLVKRELVRIITPGTTVETLALDQSTNNYLMGFIRENNDVGVSFCDFSTGEFYSGVMKYHEFLNEVRRIAPAEIIFPSSYEQSDMIETLKKTDSILNSYEDRFFYHEKAEQSIKDHFHVLDVQGFGLTTSLMVGPAGAILSYLKDTQKTDLSHLTKIQLYSMSNIMFLDFATIRNLEIVKSVLHSSSEGTLLHILDKTITPMGKRLLKKWITSPLIDKGAILKRLLAVAELKNDILRRNDLLALLFNVYDIERLITRIAFGNANPKDLISLRDSLLALPQISKLLEGVTSYALQDIAKMPDFSPLVTLISEGIKEEPNTSLTEGNIIKDGYHEELDSLRDIRKNVREFLANLEEKERESTGIKSLKIKFNKVFGYFIEVSKSNLHLVPQHYIRKQTQVNAERFITEELKEMEAKILGAEERINELEQQLFFEIVQNIRKHVTPIQETAFKIATLDCFLSFATASEENNYVQPTFNDDQKLEILGGRHPVIEKLSDDPFIPNDCVLDKENRTMIITGPNLAGKSTYLRGCALILLMAQVGCFVPAQRANLPLIDRIFSRIGAYDDLIHGQSTFMVEMTETANILNNATENSFVILDEIGRGTSTFDGVSLAWAIAEYLHKTLKAKTLFATHYHHLNELSRHSLGIKNYNVLVDERDDKILFLRKIVEGGTDRSYGIQVAKLAGVPEEVIRSAKKIMNLIETEDTIGERILDELNKQQGYDQST